MKSQQKTMYWLVLVAALCALGSKALLTWRTGSGPMPLPCVSTTTPTDAYTITPVGSTIMSVNERTGTARYWSPGQTGTWILAAEIPAQPAGIGHERDARQSVIWTVEASGDQAGRGDASPHPAATILSMSVR